MEIRACPRCGSTKIYQGNLGDGVLTGYTSRQVCKNCGFQGMPVIFNNEKEYKKFIKDLKNERSKNPEIVHKNNQKIKRNKNKKSSIRPVGLSIVSMLLICETIIAIFIFSPYITMIHLANVPGMLYLSMFMLTGIILPIGFIKGYSWSFTIGGVLFIFTMPINLPFLYYITRPHVKQYLLNEKSKN